MNRKVLSVFIVITSIVFAQNTYDSDQFADEGVDYFSAPFHWDENDFLFLGATAGLTFGAMQFDADFKNFSQKNRRVDSPIHILIGRYYGEPILPVLLSSYFLINGNSTGNRYQKQLGFEIAQSTFFAMATTQILKMIFGRERPSNTNDPTNFTGLTFWDNDYFSLPSGHTTIAFALSATLAENTNSTFLKIISFLPALCTAYSRIYENRHWFSDVVLGSIIGYTAAHFFNEKHEQLETPTNPKPITLFKISLPIK